MNNDAASLYAAFLLLKHNEDRASDVVAKLEPHHPMFVQPLPLPQPQRQPTFLELRAYPIYSFERDFGNHHICILKQL